LGGKKNRATPAKGNVFEKPEKWEGKKKNGGEWLHVNIPEEGGQKRLPFPGSTNAQTVIKKKKKFRKGGHKGRGCHCLLGELRKLTVQGGTKAYLCQGPEKSRHKKSQEQHKHLSLI